MLALDLNQNNESTCRFCLVKKSTKGKNPKFLFRNFFVPNNSLAVSLWIEPENPFGHTTSCPKE
jgi:hypothetical protein